MSFKVADRVRETSVTTGTAAMALAGNVSSYQAFGTVLSNGDTCPYFIANQSASEWEGGIGTYNSGANTLTRTTVQVSSNSNGQVTFSAGTKDVFLVSRAADFALLSQANTFAVAPKVTPFNAAGVVTNDATGQLATNAALPITLGGTNAATAAQARVNLGLDQVGGTYGGDTVTAAQTITLIQSAPFAFTINSLKNLGTLAGTVTGTLNINGSPVTGLSALSLTSTPQNATATAANAVAIGNTVTFVTSSAASLTGLLPFSLVGTR